MVVFFIEKRCGIFLPKNINERIFCEIWDLFLYGVAGKMMLTGRLKT